MPVIDEKYTQATFIVTIKPHFTMCNAVYGHTYNIPVDDASEADAIASALDWLVGDIVYRQQHTTADGVRSGVIESREWGGTGIHPTKNIGDVWISLSAPTAPPPKPRGSAKQKPGPKPSDDSNTEHIAVRVAPIVKMLFTVARGKTTEADALREAIGDYILKKAEQAAVSNTAQES